MEVLYRDARIYGIRYSSLNLVYISIYGEAKILNYSYIHLAFTINTAALNPLSLAYHYCSGFIFHFPWL